MKKKLAILLYRYFPYGGLQKDFLGITKELLARGHEIKVYTRSWEGDVPENLDVVELGEKGFSNYSKNKTYVSKAFSSLKSFFPDIVFGFNKMPGLDLYFAADTCFAKQSLKKSPLQKYTRRYRQSMEFEKEVFSRDSKSKILLLNEIQSQNFQDIYSTQLERLTLIPPGIEKNWNLHESINITEKLNLPKNEKIILFVGSDFSRKGLDRAIFGISHLLKQNISATLLVLGDDNKGPYDKIIKELSLNDRVIFLGPRKDVASFMKSSHLLVHPAREEAAGNIIIEALVSGLPSLVSSEVGFSTEVLKHNSGMVVEGEFKQERFNFLLEESLSYEKLTSFREMIKPLAGNNYFYSRFNFVADFIEEAF
jgi:UDP-glucose:(heptosyl)LPS alpha-1,3-glucosyltransferase